jgi:hypothetical protein|tara:strand:- start:931 stop:1170 length:240 start_codon:yes stop_codon:yes gene_type:complete
VLRHREVFIRSMSFAENVVFLFKYEAIKSKKLFSGLAYILECEFKMLVNKEVPDLPIPIMKLKEGLKFVFLFLLKIKKC